MQHLLIIVPSQCVNKPLRRLRSIRELQSFGCVIITVVMKHLQIILILILSKSYKN